MRTGIPEECIRLVFQGKLLADSLCFRQGGIRRDSTVHLALAAHAVVNPKAPNQVRLRLFGKYRLVSRVVTLPVSDAMTINDVARAACHLLDLPFSSKLSKRDYSLLYEGMKLCPERPLAMYKLPEDALLDLALEEWSSASG